MNAPRNQIRRAWTQEGHPGTILHVEVESDALVAVSTYVWPDVSFFYLTPADARMIIAALTPLAEVSEVTR